MTLDDAFGLGESLIIVMFFSTISLIKNLSINTNAISIRTHTWSVELYLSAEILFFNLVRHLHYPVLSIMITSHRML
jgi:hypothetical protein